MNTEITLGIINSPLYFKMNKSIKTDRDWDKSGTRAAVLSLNRRTENIHPPPSPVGIHPTTQHASLCRLKEVMLLKSCEILFTDLGNHYSLVGTQSFFQATLLLMTTKVKKTQ